MRLGSTARNWPELSCQIQCSPFWTSVRIVTDEEQGRIRNVEIWMNVLVTIANEKLFSGSKHVSTSAQKTIVIWKYSCHRQSNVQHRTHNSHQKYEMRTCIGMIADVRATIRGQWSQTVSRIVLPIRFSRGPQCGMAIQHLRIAILYSHIPTLALLRIPFFLKVFRCMADVGAITVAY